MRRRMLLFAPVLALPAVAARPVRSQRRPSVVASFSILGDMVTQIAGAEIALRIIAEPNADAHAFQSRPSDVGSLRDAALVVKNGLGFDNWMDRMIRAADYRGPVATTTDGITPRRMEPHAHEHGQPHRGQERTRSDSTSSQVTPDPHAWQDPRLGATYARNIARTLASADPARAATHREAGEAYAARLEALDAWIRQQLAMVPDARRVVVTSHDAFGYFGAAYGIRFLAPQGVSTSAEPSAAQVARLIRQIRAEGTTAVFLENVGNAATLERLAREAGVRIGGRLYADSLSPPDGPVPTYESMFRHNLSLLVPAMLGRPG